MADAQQKTEKANQAKADLYKCIAVPTPPNCPKSAQDLEVMNGQAEESEKEAIKAMREAYKSGMKATGVLTGGVPKNQSINKSDAMIDFHSEKIKKMLHAAILLLSTVLFISGCIHLIEFKSKNRNIHEHSIININNYEIYIPDFCKLSYLNYDDDLGFATMLCKSGVDNELNALSLLDLRRNKEKESIVTKTMTQKRNINSHECGIILYPKLSCYLMEMGVLISSDNIFVLEEFTKYQYEAGNSQRQD